MKIVEMRVTPIALNDAVGPLTASQTVAPQSSFGAANYGLLGGADSVVEGADEGGVVAQSDAQFSDLIAVSSASSAANAIIPYTVTMSLYGNYTISIPPLFQDGDGPDGDTQLEVTVSSDNVNGSGTLLSGFYINDNGEDDWPSGAPSPPTTTRLRLAR